MHVLDHEFIDIHFGTKDKKDKYKPHEGMFGMPQSVFSTASSDLHKIRRTAIAPSFSRRSILALEPMISEKVGKACSRLESSRSSGKAMDLRLLFTCLTTDIISEFTFVECFNLLDTEDLAPAWRKLFSEGARSFQWFKHFPSLWPIFRSIPDQVIAALIPSMESARKFERTAQKLMKESINNFEPSLKKESSPKVLHDLLASDLPDEEKRFDRLWQDASIILAAGVETTANTLTVILFHLATIPEYNMRLKDELRAAIPDVSQQATLHDLERLPFLSAIVSEGLRKAYGTTTRMIRVAPEAITKFNGYKFPPGTAMSMSPMPMLDNPQIFEQPEIFRPERFLEKNSRAELMVFGKGPRMCLGQKQVLPKAS